VEGYGRTAERFFRQFWVDIFSNKHAVILNCSDSNGDDEAFTLTKSNVRLSVGSVRKRICLNNQLMM
jgi:hypothetical protein